MEKYRRIKIVGQGSFAYALLVQSKTTRKYYIIKVISVANMEKKKRQETVNEIHVLKKLEHPFIIGYRESFIEKKSLCIVMDFADGGDLGERLTKQKETGTYLREDQALTWFVQIALALKHIHSRKILHRDLKTQNIFLTADGWIKVGDFGISRVLESTADLAVTAIGTPYYLSPEICEKQPYDYKSDIWSLGCLLYEMLSFKRPFQASSIGVLVISILSGKYRPLPAHWSEEIKGLVAQMLSVDPKERPSIDEILEKPFIKKKVAAVQKELYRKDFISPKELKAEHTSIDTKPVKDVRERKTTSRLLKCRGRLVSQSKKELHEYSTRVEQPRSSSNLRLCKKLEKVDDSKESTSAFSSDCDYASLMKSLTNCIKSSKAFQRGDNPETLAQDFLLKLRTPEGSEIPGLSATGSVASNIEIAKMYLEKELGEQKFNDAYKFLEEPPKNDSPSQGMLGKILGKSGLKYLPLLYQLLVYESTFYGK